MLNTILERTKSPVARARLLSGGVKKNNRLEKGTLLLGDAGCLACGNCVDNCPVMADKFQFIVLQNQRTSMFLENMVGDECRRCYRCINACPQVAKAVKEYALSFRRGEKIIHLITLLTLFCLAGSGITLYHWGDLLPALEVSLLKWGHRFLGVLLLLLPLLFWLIDKDHMKATLKKALVWGKKDTEWIKQMARHLRHPKQTPMPVVFQFNPAQKIWIGYLFLVMTPILGLTGIGQWWIMSFSPESTGFLAFLAFIHAALALCTDMLLILHIYIKYIRRFIRTAVDIVTCYLRNGHFMYWDAPHINRDKEEKAV